MSGRSRSRSRSSVMGKGAIARARTLYAIDTLSAANYYATQNPGGEAGSGSGFGCVIVAHVDALGTSAMTILNRGNAAVTNGWSAILNASNQIVFTAASGAAAAVSSPTYQLVASDVGKLLFIACWHDGTKLRLAVSKSQAADGTAITGYTALSGATQLSGVSGSPATQPATSVDAIGWLTFTGTPTKAQLDTLADTTRALGDLPDTFTGATVTHLWSAKRELAGTFPVSGQTAPASLADRITGAAADAMSRAGSPTVVVIDPSIDGRKTYGAQGASAADYLATAAGLGIRGHASGFWVSWYGRVDRQSTDTSEFLFTAINNDATTGWQVYIDTNMTRLVGGAFNNAASFRAATYILPTSVVGVPSLFAFVATGADNILYVNGVQVGTVTCVSPPPANASYRMIIGNRHNLTAGEEADKSSHFGAAGGDAFVPTPAEILAHYQAVTVAGKMQPIPGKTTHLYDLTTDILANGGPQNGIPEQVLDSVGTDHLTRQGTGLTVASRLERIWSYEVAPILYGYDGFTTDNYFEATTGIPGSAAGFWVACLFRPDALSGTRMLTAVRGESGAGWQAYMSAGALQASITTDTANYVSPSVTLTSADIGKLILFVMVFDATGAKIRAYCKRAEVGSGTATTGTYAAPALPHRIGRSSSTTDYSAQGKSIFGVWGGNGIPTLAEIRALHDACMTEESAQAIPGKTDKGWRFDSSGNATTFAGSEGMTKVGSPTVVSQYTRSWGW